MPGTTKEEGGEIPQDVSDRIIADVRSLIASKAPGFENRTRAGETLGVKQPSVTAWLAGKSRVSYKVARTAEQKLGKDYLGDPQDTTETREWGMKWKAFSMLVRDGFDARTSYAAVDQQQHDRSRGNVSWGDIYEGAKLRVEQAPEVSEADIPPAKGPQNPKPTSRKPNRKPNRKPKKP